MKPRLVTLAVLACGSILAACSGGGARVAPAAPASVQNSPRPGTASSALVAFRIVVPHVAGSGRRRGPRYVSAATKSAVIAVSPGSASPVTVDCTSTCSGQIAAPVGTDSFSVKLYDAAAGGGNLLSTGTATAVVAIDVANQVNVTFNGVVVAVALVIGGAGVYATPATVPVAVNALDSDGNIIVGPGVYVDANDNPLSIALSNSDTSGHTTLSSTSVSQPSTVTLAYDGASYASATITATVAAKTASAVFTVNCAPVPATTAVFTNADDYNGANPVTLERFPVATNGNDPSPAASFSLGALNAQALAVDNAGQLYEEGSLYGPSGYQGELIETFCGNATTGVPRSYIVATTSSMLGAAVYSIAVDSAHNVYAAVDTTAGGTSSRAIVEFAAGSGSSTLASPPTATPALRSIVVPPDSALSQQPSSIAVDATGAMYLANNDSVFRYGSGTPSGAQPPNITYKNVPASGLLHPLGVASDAQANVYGLFQNDLAVNGGLAFAVGVFAPGNSTAPARVIAGPAAVFGQYSGPGANSPTYGFPIALAVDAAGNVFVLNRGGAIDSGNGFIREPSSVAVFAPGANGNTAPMKIIDLSPDSVYPTGLAIDAADNVYVSDSNRVPGGTAAAGSWYEYAFNGAHVRTVKDAFNTRAFTTISVDPAGNVAVLAATTSASASGDVLIYGPTASGSSASIRDVVIPHAALVTKLGFDATANLYVEKDESADHSFLQLSKKRVPKGRRRLNVPGRDLPPAGNGSPDPMISVYGPAATGTASPIRTFSDPLAFNSESPGMSVGADGTVYVANAGGSVLNVYAPAASGGGAAPVASYWNYGPSTVGSFIATGPAGDLVIVSGLAPAISVYASGSVSLTRSIAGPLTKITAPGGLAVDSAGEILVLDLNLNAILVFGPQQSGNVAPIRVISRTEPTTQLLFQQVAAGPG